MTSHIITPLAAQSRQNFDFLAVTGNTNFESINNSDPKTPSYGLSDASFYELFLLN